jgi:hypothetical protein
MAIIPQEELAKYGYRSERKVIKKKEKDPSIFWLFVGT